MRITSGTLKNKKINAPNGLQLRPTIEKVRQAIYNTLEHGLGASDFNIFSSTVADFFAGSGAMGIEAISKGASHVSFFEINKEHLSVLKKNIDSLNLLNKCQIYYGDSLSFMSSLSPFDLIIIDPPYGKGMAQESINIIKKFNLIKGSGIIVVESDHKENLSLPVEFNLIKEKVYGKTKVSFINWKDK